MAASLPDPLLEQFSGFLSRRVGLCFPSERWPDLLRALERMAAESGLADAAACIQWILSAPLDRERVEILARYLTVGETYFYRDPAVFAALENRILPELIAMRRASGQRQLRIWSAGCCSGEEPYTIAMLLCRLLPDLAQWNITLLATDINPQFLAKAKKGEYREWSFRATPAWIRNGYFQAGETGGTQLAPRILHMVRFNYLNLMDDSYPAPDNNTNGMDIIFCRNVLMYFEAGAMHAVLEKFCRALLDGGWLVLGPNEANARLSERFSPVSFTDATLYRKGEKPSLPLTPVSPGDASPLPSAPPIQTPSPDVQSGAAAILAPFPAGPDAVQTLALAARARANEGRLEEAYRLCLMAIASEKLNPGLRYLLASILSEQGRQDEMAVALKQALYLDQHHVLAHFVLGNWYQGQGLTAAASRHFANARELLAGYAPECLLPDADGLSAGQLLDMLDHRENRS